MPTSLSWTLVETVDTNQASTASGEAGSLARKNLRLDPLTGELDLTSGQLHFTSGAEAVQQALTLRLQAVEGEWFLDTTLGIPLHDEIIGIKNPDLVAIQALYREVILGTPGVTGLLSLALTLGTDRQLSLSFAATGDFGQLVATGVVTP